MIRRLASVGGFTLVFANCGDPAKAAPTYMDAPVADSKLVAACAHLEASHISYYRTVSECLFQNLGPGVAPYPDRVTTFRVQTGVLLFGSLACLATATSEAAVGACLDTFAGACRGEPRCEGNHLENCTNQKPYHVDCSFAPGPMVPETTCFMTKLGPRCGAGTCSDTDPPRCDGDHVVACIDSVLERSDCVQLPQLPAMTCRDGNCVPSGPPCPAGVEHFSHCEGDDLVKCDDDHEYRTRCASFPLPMTCRKSDCISNPNLRCAPESYGDRCNGTMLSYCDGAERTVDCRSLGFSACTAGACTW